MTTWTRTASRRVEGALPRALGLAALIIAAEYLARRIVAPLVPTLGAPRVNDMVAAAICYGALVLITVPAARRTPGATRDVARQIVAAARHWQPWVGALAIMAAIVALSPLDQFLWGRVALPGYSAAPLTEAIIFPAAGPTLTIVSLLLVNGVVIPLCEERLWRGLIQPGLVGVLGFAPGLFLTALLFSLKHAVVDASLGRLLTLLAFGLIVGWIASRGGWKWAAVTHIAVNTASTILSLAVAGS